MTHDEKIVEAVATAEVRYDGYEDLLCLSRTMRERYLDRARAAITAYQAEAWQGYKLVPLEPTQAMLDAVKPFPEHLRHEHPDPSDPWHAGMAAAVAIDQMTSASLYRDMVEAAPLPPAPKATP